MRRVALVILMLTGCVPYPLYQTKERELSASYGQRNEDAKRLATCEERVRGLKESVKDAAKQKQTTIIVPMAVENTINQKELEEIKKRALEETEKKFHEKVPPR